MTNVGRRALGSLTFAVVVGFVYPYGELAWKCREERLHSESCVWGRAYFPLSRWVEPAIITPAVFGLAMGFFAIADRKR